MMIMLPISTAASVAASTSENAVNGASEVNTAACYTPVTDPDSIALLAAMHEANRCLIISVFVAVTRWNYI